MFKKISFLAPVLFLGLLLGRSAQAGGGINMVTGGGDVAEQFQTNIKDGTVEWQGPDVTVRVVNDVVYVIKDGATIKLTNTEVEVSGNEALQVRKVEQVMGGGINMLNGSVQQPSGGVEVQGGGIDMNRATVTTVTPVKANLNQGFATKIFSKIGLN
ncbi:MAG: hypothetical protein K8R69_09775 [Deltaproteobacteria bacterium]|nr:hypothetical protein [Deltaproteobacteria bacterium]